MTLDLRAPTVQTVLPGPDYLIDATQRGLMFLDLLRRRGNEEIRMEADSGATVLRFAHEEIMSGRSLARPLNYSLTAR